MFLEEDPHICVWRCANGIQPHVSSSPGARDVPPLPAERPVEEEAHLPSLQGDSAVALYCRVTMRALLGVELL